MMRLVQRVIFALAIMTIASCNHQYGRSNGAGGLRGNADFSDQPQDGSLIVTPEGTREIKIQRQEEDPEVEN
ncbi:MAG: hypothetical protein MK183_03165 [Verrucomicrobiales bacterium]|nr:hypothetical protein [Verrucomicrobiales bacterium]